MTPFELSLDNDLQIEWQRFANDWLFKWHGMTYEGGITDVEDFRGGRIRYKGIKFGDQQQQVFWEAVERYLIQKIHEVFKRWDTETAGYSAEIRVTSIDGVQRSLRQFVHRIIQHSLDTDRRLRGMGYPENVRHFDSSKPMSSAETEIAQLAQAYRALLEESKEQQDSLRTQLWSKRLEDFYANNKGLIWLGGICITVISAVWRFVLGG
jgi:hypothetical protein